jgi:hypothetical protein
MARWPCNPKGVLPPMGSLSISWDSHTVLPLGCQSYDRAPGRDADIPDLVDEPRAEGRLCIHRVRLPEEGADLGLAELRPLLDDRADA